MAGPGELRRVAFKALAGALAVVFGVVFFGLISLVIPALLIGSAIASDFQNLVPALILLPCVGTLLALHPAREEFLRREAAFSVPLLCITVLGAVPLVVYALDMGAQAQDLLGPPHHVQRLSTMAAMAIAIVLVGLLAALRTRGWRTPAWSAGTAAIVFGLASMAFPDQRGAGGRGWGGIAIAGGVLFIAAAELENRTKARRETGRLSRDLDLARRSRDKGYSHLSGSKGVGYGHDRG